GIRDFHVTGVQTCALPIYYEGKNCADAITYYQRYLAEGKPDDRFRALTEERIDDCKAGRGQGAGNAGNASNTGDTGNTATAGDEIGRASSRETFRNRRVHR